MGRKINDQILSIRLGALYRFALIRNLSRETVITLMKERCGMTTAEAQRLSGHWFGTWHFRNRKAA